MEILFKIEGGEVTLDKAALASKTIGKLVRRDRGGIMIGDANGNKKLRAFAELGLIWYCVNVNSPGMRKGYEGAELVKEGKKFFDIPDTWKADEHYANALDEYTKIYNDSVVVKSLKGAISGFRRTLDLVDKINTALVRYNEDQSEFDVEKVDSVIKLNNGLTSISNDMPDKIKKLKELEKIYLIEETSKSFARGGVRITPSMIPDIN